MSRLCKWISENPPDPFSFFQISRHVALLLLLSSGRRVHDLTLLEVTEDRFQRVPPDIIFWPTYGSKTDSRSRRQSGWHFSPNPSDPLWDVPHWVEILLSLRQKRLGSLDLPSLFISSRGVVKPASRAIIGKWITSALSGAKISASAGSCRSAVNSALARANLPIDEILSRANWKCSGTFLRHYFREIAPHNSCALNPLTSSFKPTQ